MNTNTKEILTFQFGNYANYVGAHWWNLQECTFNFDDEDDLSDIDHHVLYREGKNSNECVTFTPRVLIVDLDKNVKGISKISSLYGDNQLEDISSDNQQVSESDSKYNWYADKINVIENESETKISELTPASDEELFSNDTGSWIDIVDTQFHPRSILLVKDKTISVENDVFPSGENLWESNVFQDDFVDNIRKYIEECNNCQGFQTLFDSTNGFVGVAGKCLQYLKDEYKKVSFAVPIFPPQRQTYDKCINAMRLVNIASSYSDLIQYSDLFVPLSTEENIFQANSNCRKFKYINYSKSPNDTSAIIATYLETISLRYRFKSRKNSSHLFEFCSDLNGYGRNLVAAALALPFPMQSDCDIFNTLNEIEYPFFTQLTPNCNINNCYTQSVCIRGIPQNRLKRPFRQTQSATKMPTCNYSSISEMFQSYFQSLEYRCLSHICATELPIKIQNSYLNGLFNPYLNKQGFLIDNPRNLNTEIESLPSVAFVQASEDLSNILKSLHFEANKVNVSRFHRFKETGMELEDYVEILESLLQFKDRYDDTMNL